MNLPSRIRSMVYPVAMSLGATVSLGVMVALVGCTDVPVNRAAEPDADVLTTGMDLGPGKFDTFTPDVRVDASTDAGDAGNDGGEASECPSAPSAPYVSQPVANHGVIIVRPHTSVGQSFQVPHNGTLAGVEFSLSCQTLGDTLHAELFEETPAGLVSLGIVDGGAAKTALCLSPTNLSNVIIGYGYFDFSSLCLQVKASKTYRIELRGGTQGVCTHTYCSVGRVNSTCSNDRQCDTTFSVGVGYPDLYPSGIAYDDGVATPGVDFAFKVSLSPDLSGWGNGHQNR